MNTAPVLGSRDNVIAIHDGRLISFDTANRKIGWEIAGGFAGQPVIADGVIYAVANGALTARNELSGDFLWQWQNSSRSLEGELFVTDNLAFVRTSVSTHAVDLNLKQEAWSYPEGGHMTLSEHALYIAAEDGLLTAINVPEPCTAVMLMLAAPFVLRLRNRPRPSKT